MKKLLLIFALFGLVSFANGETVREILPPPVKETPALTKKFNRQHWEMSVAIESMGFNLNAVKKKKLDFFNDEFRGFVKTCQKYQPSIEKGLYNKRSLMSFFGCGSALVETSRVYKLLIEQRKGEIEVFRYEELLQKTANMRAYGVYIHNNSLRSLKKYYNEHL